MRLPPLLCRLLGHDRRRHMRYRYGSGGWIYVCERCGADIGPRRPY